MFPCVTTGRSHVDKTAKMGMMLVALLEDPQDIAHILTPVCMKRHFQALESCPCKEVLHENTGNQ